MSGVIKGIGKVIGGVADFVGDVLEGVVDVVKKAWPIIAIAAVAYFTGGFGVSAMAAGGGGAAAGGAAAGGTAAMAGPATVSGVAGGAAAGSAAAGGAAAGIGGASVTGGAAGAGLGGAGATGGGAALAGTGGAAGGSLSNAAASGIHPGTGIDPAIESAGASITSPNMPASEVSNNVSQSIAQSEATGAGAEAAQVSAQESATNPALQSSIDDMVASNPELFGNQEGGFMSGVNKVFSNTSNWMEEHPYLTQFGAQTLSNLSQPSPNQSRRWPGAFYGMEHDGRTVEGKKKIQNYAPGTEPSPGLLGRAKAAAEGRSPNVDPSRLKAGVKLNKMNA